MRNKSIIRQDETSSVNLRTVTVNMATSSSSGKETEEYKSVLAHLGEITKHLKLNDGAKLDLTQKYREKSWIDIAENPDEDRLIRLALIRIETEVADFDVFIDMLKSTVGMDSIVTKILSTL